MSEPDFQLSSADEARRTAAQAYERWLTLYRTSLPDEADIRHVGATSIPGALTKGDLDIAIRLGEGEFAVARDALDRTHTQNLKSVRDDSFAAYEADGFACPVGVQLVVRGSKLDVFDAFREALLGDETKLAAYNALKLEYQGRPMAEYRAAKSEFIAKVLKP